MWLDSLGCHTHFQKLSKYLCTILYVWKSLLCQQTFESKKFVDITQQCFALLPQVNFTANNLNFHWRWRWLDPIQAIFLNLFYFMLCQKILELIEVCLSPATWGCWSLHKKTNYRTAHWNFCGWNFEKIFHENENSTSETISPLWK